MMCIGAMDLILYAMEIVKPESRFQLRKDKLSELYVTIIAIKNYLKEEESAEFNVTLEALLDAITTAEKLQYEILPDNVRGVIGEALIKLKYYIADITFKYHSVQPFEETEANIRIMREVVECEANTIKKSMRG